MTEYICDKCGKMWSRKNDYMRHINKKFACNNVVLIDKYDLLKKELEEIKECNKKKLEEIKEYNKKKLDKIKECNKKELDEIKKFNTNLLKKMNDLESTIKKINKNIVNSHNTIGTLNKFDNHISIIVSPTAFGKEDISFINDKTSRQILNKVNNSIPEFIKMLHFSEDKPEYHNIYLPNWRDNTKILVFDGVKWNLENKDDILDDLKEKGIDFIQKKFDELDDKKDELLIKKLREIIKSYENDDKKKLDKLEKNLLLILYNNREVAEKTRKYNKKQEHIITDN
jgi:hypothetical protein